MLTRSLLLAIVISLPLGLMAAEDPVPPPKEVAKPDPAAAQAAAKITRIEKRLEANVKRIEKHRADRESVVATTKEAEDNLAKLAALLKTIDDLQAKATSQAQSNNTVSVATLNALQDANNEAAPLQRNKRTWVRTISESKNALAGIDRAIAGLEVERGRIEADLAKATAPPAAPPAAP